MSDIPESPTDPSNEQPADDGTAHAETASADAPQGEPPDIAPPILALLAAIRAAVTPGASAEARAAGATACSSIKTVLDAKPGEPLLAAAAPAASPRSAIAAMLAQPGFLAKLAAMPREQLLDLVKQATGAVPSRTSTPATSGPRFHIVELPLRGRR